MILAMLLPKPLKFNQYLNLNPFKGKRANNGPHMAVRTRNRNHETDPKRDRKNEKSNPMIENSLRQNEKTTDTNIQTTLIRSGIGNDTAHGSVMPPLYMSSNYTFKDLGEKRQYDYTRSGNPTRDELGVALADLEGGAGAVITSTGMSTITLALHLTKSGDHVVAPHDCYGGSYRLLKAYHDQGRITCHFVDQNDQAALTAALSHNPSLVLIETPSNPLLRVVDVAKIAKQAKAVGGRETIVAVDNTFLSPAQQRPITLGADLVLHSTTKYLNGHSDVVGGAVIAKTPELLEQVAWWANCLGITGSPFDSYQTLRGLRTLFVRIKQAASTTLALAKALEKHPAIEQVYFPGLESSPSHALAKKQQTGFGDMLSFEVKGGYDELRSFILGLKHFSLAESLGGVESLIAHPATMTHAAMEPSARITAGISDNLVRISVGIEDETDLINDILESLANAYAQNDNQVLAAE